MPYCRVCDVAHDTGTRYCPTCGAECIQPVSADVTTETREASPHDDGLVIFALRYPFRAGASQLLVGAGLLFLSVFVVPFLVVLGYAYRVGAAAARGDERPPRYGDWGGLLKDGVLVGVVVLPMVLFATLALVFLSTFAETTESALVGILTLLASVAVLYCGWALVPTFCGTGSVRETYREGLFLQVAATRRHLLASFLYILAGVLLWVALWVALVVATVLLFVTLLGIVLIPLLWIGVLVTAVPFALAFTGAWWGYVWHELAIDHEEREHLGASL